MKAQLRAQGRKKDPEGTRERLLQCAFDEIYEHGYAGAGLDRILANSGVTKGALYHHFGSKSELAHAMIDELLTPFVVERWVRPLQQSDDPVTAISENFADIMENLSDHELRCGCPLNNLAQELSGTEDGFREHLCRVFDLWRGGISDALARGKEAGSVREDVDPDATASYLVASFEGMASMMKNVRDMDAMRPVAAVFLQYLETLRPAPSGAVAA